MQMKDNRVAKLLPVIALILALSCGWSEADQLFVSAAAGDAAKVKELLVKGVDPNHRFQHLQREFEPYETPIIGAAENGHLEIVKMLVDAGADINARNSKNWRTAIYYAVLNKDNKMIDYLLDKGANTNQSEHFGVSLLMLAIKRDDFNLIKKLVKYGAYPDPTVKDVLGKVGEMGDNAIMCARTLKRPYVNYLIEQERYCDRLMKSGIVSCKRF